jgi:hypothetical protein
MLCEITFHVEVAVRRSCAIAVSETLIFPVKSEVSETETEGRELRTRVDGRRGRIARSEGRRHNGLDGPSSQPTMLMARHLNRITFAGQQCLLTLGGNVR